MNAQPVAPAPDFVCRNIYCRYHVSQPLELCPKCGVHSRFLSNSRLRRVQIICGVGLIIGGGVIWCWGLSMLETNAGRVLKETPFWVFPAIFGVGGLPVAGGVSLSFGKEWFIRMILICFGWRPA
jgi:hypothetical protein